MIEQIDTGTDGLIASKENGIATITLNRPEVRNALNTDMVDGFIRTLQYFESDSETRVLTLTGSGGTFCSGIDVKDLQGGKKSLDDPTGDATPLERIRNVQKAQDALIMPFYEFSKPTIAVLSGTVVGAGLSLALAADIRIASQSAVMTAAFAKLGLSGDLGITWLLTQSVGPAKAKELFYTSRTIKADEALSLGMLNHVCEDDHLESFSHTLATEISLAAPVALRFAKENINLAVTSDLRTSMNQEADRNVRCSLTHDHKEAVRAFVEKRKAPLFQGN